MKTIDYLFSLQGVGIKLGLDNIREILKRLGNPQESFRSVHIAGTNGKGSTAAMISALFKEAGNRTGLFTSPHILSFTERIKVDDTEISKDKVVELAEVVRKASEDLNPTFFEVVTAMAFLYFKEKQVGWAVIETGLGGRLDSTNIILPEVCIITPVGIDHRDFLGDTLTSIASEKAGILKKGVPGVLAPQKPEALEVIVQSAKRLEATLLVAGKNFKVATEEADHGHLRFHYISDEHDIHDIDLPLAGAYQAQNAGLALRAFELITRRYSHAEFNTLVKSAMKKVRWPGRLELVSDDPPTYVDGAHNPEAARALAEELSVRPLAPPGEFVLVMGLMKDKDIKEVMRPLLPLAEEIFFAPAAFGRSALADDLVHMAKEMGHNSRGFLDIPEALAEARATQKTVLVTGSFYVLGEALEALGKKGVLRDLQEWSPKK